MKRLGRFIALPLLIIAMALQGLAPAQAAAMPRDAFGQPICSVDGVGGDIQKKAPLHQGHEHDCCAAACAAAFVVVGPVAAIGVELPPGRSTDVRRGLALSTLGPRGPPGRPPNARGPPTLI